MPSPAITAMRAAGPPSRNGLTATVHPPLFRFTPPKRAKSSSQPLFPHRQFLNQTEPRLESNSRCAWHANGSLFGDRNFGLDDVFGPIPFIGGPVTRQTETLNTLHRNDSCAVACRFT